MNDSVGDTVYICLMESIMANKKIKEQKLKEIIAAICTLLNSNGGSVVLDIDNRVTSGKCLPSSQTQVSTVIRMLEQSMISIVGVQLTISNIHFQEDKESVVISVKKADSLITTNYNLYLPSSKQVVLVPATETPDKINDIINRKTISQAVVLRSHEKRFCKNLNCNFKESKVGQFKFLKSDASKRTTLADRITGKGNKFSCYVSAFANYNGGHIYYGINDDGVVEGQFIPSEGAKTDLIKKVTKAINKMIWPELIGQPKQGEHWEIFFQPVVDENSENIPSTFVIVIFIAPCLGGVFTEEPECYEMVEGKVEKMSCASWKKRISVPGQSNSVETNVAGQPHAQNPCTSENETSVTFTNSIVDCSPQKAVSRWSSNEAKRNCIHVGNFLMKTINNGKWKEFDRKANLIRQQTPRIDVELIVLSKSVIARSRRSHFKRARAILNQFYEMLPDVNDKPYFDTLGSYLEIVLKRNQKSFRNIDELLTRALSNAENIEIGYLTAAIFTLAATVSSFTDTESGIKQEECCRKAIDHLRRIEEPNSATWDMLQKAYITLVLIHLKCALSKELILGAGCLDTVDMTNAKSALEAFNGIKHENPTSRYREIQHRLAQSVLYYRQSQVKDGDVKVRFLESAINLAGEAMTLARELTFEEMVWWSKTVIKVCTEELVLSQSGENKLNTTVPEAPWEGL